MANKTSSILASIGLLIILSLAIAGCSPTVKPVPPVVSNNTAVNPANQSILVQQVQGNNQFAFELYKNLQSDPQYKDSNVFFSPYSMSTALAMTYEGAKGDTASEMQTTLHMSSDDSARRSAFFAIQRSINEPNDYYKLSTANALWVEETYSLLPSYSSLVQDYYAGNSTNLDFAKNPEPSRIKINDWVSDNTDGKITGLMPRNSITSGTRLVLTNTIYFNGSWVTPFEKESTAEKDFHLTSTATKKVQMMNLYATHFMYGEDSSMQVLQMDYKGDKLAMVIVLPKDGKLDDVDAKLTADQIDRWEKSMSSKRVNVHLPKFKFDTKYLMNEPLKQMGMPTAFTDSADFSGISGKADLAISIIVHQAFVDVNEKGTEAAAATGIGMAATSFSPQQEPPKDFNVDHPFIFLIKDKSTGQILFIGKVMNPST